MSLLFRFRERLVLGPILQSLDEGEAVVAWSHASLPGARAPGLFVVTQQRCLLQVASPSVPDVETPLSRLRIFEFDRRSATTGQLRLRGDEAEIVAEFSLTSRHRTRAMGRILAQLARAEVGAPPSFDPSATSPLPPVVRGVRDHARRVWVTVLGALVLVVSLLFASPFVPGPGALTAVAGLAILAREYEWARDVHLWSARQVDRFVSWIRGRRGGDEPAEHDHQPPRHQVVSGS